MNKKRRAIPWMYSMPALILVGIVIIFPIIYTAYISLTNMNLYHWNNYGFTGLENYKRALLKADSGFLAAIFTTLIWTVVNMVAQLVLAYLIALGLNVEGLKLKRVYKTLLMFPWAMPAYVSILLWKVCMYNTEFGLLNQILVKMGGSKLNYLSENVPAFLACTVLNLWMALPFMIMMIDGALQSIDNSYYECARLEGANFWQKSRYVTLPCIRQIIAPAAIMTTFTTLKQFDIVYLLTKQKGALTGASIQTIITYAHQNAFVSNNYGLSSAVSVLIFIIIIVFSIFTNKGLREENRS